MHQLLVFVLVGKWFHACGVTIKEWWAEKIAFKKRRSFFTIVKGFLHILEKICRFCFTFLTSRCLKTFSRRHRTMMWVCKIIYWCRASRRTKHWAQMTSQSKLIKQNKILCVQKIAFWGYPGYFPAWIKLCDFWKALFERNGCEVLRGNFYFVSNRSKNTRNMFSWSKWTNS